MDVFGKAARYVFNIQKSTAFLYTSNEKSENKIKQTIPFLMVISSSRISRYTPKIHLQIQCNPYQNSK